MGPGLYVVVRSANSGLQVHWIGQAGEAVGVRRKVEALLQSRHTGINLMYNTNRKKVLSRLHLYLDTGFV